MELNTEIYADTQLDWPVLLNALAEPFSQEAVQWRVGSVSRDKKTRASAALRRAARLRRPPEHGVPRRLER